MSFFLTYHPFFVVRVKEQGSTKPFRYLNFSPTPATLKLFKDYQLIFRNRDNGFDLYYKKNEYAKPKLQASISSRVKFTFTIKVNSPSLFSLYEPDALVAPQFYLDNLTSSGAISGAAAGNLNVGSHLQQKDAVRIYPQTFQVETKQNSTNTPTKWFIKEYFSPNKILQTVNNSNPGSADMTTVTMNDPIKHAAEHIKDKGVYMLDTDKGPPEPSTIYLDDELGGRGIQGILDLYWDRTQDSVPETGGKKYQIIFKRK